MSTLKGQSQWFIAGLNTKPSLQQVSLYFPLVTHWQKHLSHCPSAWNGPLSGIGEHVPNCSQGPGWDVEGGGVVFTSKTCTFKKKVILAQKNGSCLGGFEL